MVSRIQQKIGRQPSVGDVMLEKTDKDKRLDKAIRVLTELVAKDFYGEITFFLQNGQIVNVKEVKSHKW